ncbi:MAG TPA: hypothetical protein VIM69_13115 [Opitutaceae bacterium]
MKQLPDDPSTGVPGLRTWPRLYTFVLAFLVFSIGFLIWLTERFS